MGLAYLELTLVAALWGASWLAGGFVASAEMPLLRGASMRFLFGSLGLALIAWRQGLRTPPRSLWPLLAAMGFSGVFLYNLCFFYALRTLPPGRASLTAATQPAFVYLFECLTERKRPAARPLLFIALSLGGAILVLTQGDAAKFTGAATPGDWIVWGCVLSWVTYTLLSRKAVAQFPAAGVSVWSVLIGTAMVFAGDAVTSQAAGVEAPARVWWAAAYLGLGGTAVAFSLYLKGIRAVGPTRASIFINLVPVFGVLASVAAGRETLTAPTLAGGALVIAGVYGLNRWR